MEHIIQIIILLISLGIYCLFILTLQNTFSAVSPQYRMMSPQSMWWLLLPLYHYWFLFQVVDNLSDSISLHLSNHNVHVDNPTMAAGKAFTISAIAAFLISVLSISPFLEGLASLATLLFFGIYWSQVYSYKKKVLEASDFVLDIENAQPGATV